MGLLTHGRPLPWEETKRYADFIRQHGVEQFIHIYRKLKDRRNDCLKWGDEVRKKIDLSKVFLSINRSMFIKSCY
jgi:hypothetical protein